MPIVCRVETKKAPGDLVAEVWVESRSFATERAARLAWETVAIAGLADVGATRIRDPHDPTGPGRFVVYTALGRDNWERLAPMIEGDAWDPHDVALIDFLIRRRLQMAAAGIDTHLERGPEPA
jgi:hypothetical protein